MIEEAIAMNNNGVACLALGRFFDAIALARRALQVLKDHRNDPSLGSRGSSDTTLSTAFQTNDDSRVQAIRQNETNFVYARPLLIPTDCILSSTHNRSSQWHAIVAYITFNLALSCHRFGIESGLSRPMQCALVLYQLLLTVSASQDGDPFGPAIMDLSLLRCLVWNNLACIHFENCQHDNGTSCLERMRHLIAAGCLDNVRHLTVHEVGEIKMNARFLGRPMAAGAA